MLGLSAIECALQVGPVLLPVRLSIPITVDNIDERGLAVWKIRREAKIEGAT
jgi:hypothetical protein